MEGEFDYCELQTMSANEANSTRRGFLRVTGAALAAGTLVGDGCSPKPETENDAEVHLGMVIDLQKCTGCRTCAVACKSENHTPPGVNYLFVVEDEIGEYPNVRRQFIPRPCMQCREPSCTTACPTGATYQRDDGVTVIDYDKCIGCRYCVAACPYGSRSFDFGHSYYSSVLDGQPAGADAFAAVEPTAYETAPSPEYGENRHRNPAASPVGNVRKCHFCLHRVKQGMLPACVAACPGRAMYFGNLNDPGSDVYRTGEGDRANFPKFSDRHVMQLGRETGNDPSVYYLT